MSADLLRRAAAELRQSSMDLLPPPWTTEADRVLNEDRDLVADADGPVHADFIALMHPPVALALARLLETIAMMPSIADPTDMLAATELARAILREPAS